MRHPNQLFVIGASLGGLEALRQLVSLLPADLDAAVLVVLHIPPGYPSLVADRLNAVGTLRAAEASDGEAIAAGRIYVAPPDCHMLVRDGRLLLSHGPRENFVRPAIDPLFRSAAQAYGPRVTGVVLSGTLSDGTVGLMVIKAHGGTTVVQDPKTLQFTEMSEMAIAHAPVDHVLAIEQIAALLAQKANRPPTDTEVTPMATSLEDSAAMVKTDLREQAEDARSGQITTYACPECGGSLWQIDDRNAQQFRCHVGHAYGPETLLGGMSNNLENALWTAVRALVERATLHRQMAKKHRERGRDQWASNLEQQAERDERYMRVIRENILDRVGPDQQPLTSA